jgi:WD40 repeat protein
MHLLFITPLIATSLIYVSTQTNYQANHYVFRKNDIAQGFVRIDSGFTILPTACATMDLLFSVSGVIDLRETGTIQLLSELQLDAGVTLSSGGNINGRGHRLILGGDLTVPANKILHINGDTIIDARGYNLTIGANAQIIVDTNVTLTLCNMTITNQQHASTFPPIRCAALTSKLAFDDVVFTPNGDFLFPQGQLFIHNDVAITGTSAFIYTSPVPSFITSGACWYFGINTTFSVAPATFTDAPYALKNTYTSDSFIRMADASSILYLDGCSVQVTQTGCRFSKGTIAFDNNVACRSDTTLTLTSITLRANQTYSTAVQCVQWSPDGQYVAVCGNSSLISVYKFNGTTLTSVASLTLSGVISSVNWSPDGRYLAIGGNIPSNAAQVYSFNGTSLTSVASAAYGNTAASVNWSPDGRYLAIGGNAPTSGLEIQVYRFNGTALTSVASADYGTIVYSVSWSPDGKYLAIGGLQPTSGYEAQVYSFDGTALTLISGAQVDYGTAINSVNWSPDGRCLALGGSGPSSGYEVQVYRFNGTTLILIPGARTFYSHSVYSVSWSPCGCYFGVGINTSGVRVYTFDGVTLISIPGAQISFGSFVYSLAWRPDGNYVAIGGQTPSAGHKEIEVYKSDYVNSTATQALSNSIVFGDRVSGSVYDARVNVLSGAQVNLSGGMSYDNVNA